jgi:hypothetical protein
MPKANAKSTSVPVATSKREVILKPKKCGLSGQTKPVAFIVNSPYDSVDAATKYSNTSALLEGAGYGLINKRACLWDIKDEVLATLIKPVDMKGAPLTIWIEAHGALGWFFAGTKDTTVEFLETVKFIEFIQKVAKLAKASIGTVVLNGCFTANELFNNNGRIFNLSPARMLSMLAPDIQVLGFIGTNSNVKITGVFEKKKNGTYNPLTLNPEEASVLYKAGHALESYTNAYYCSHKYTHGFMGELLGIDEDDINNEDSYYQTVEVLGFLAAHKITGTGYGAQQLKWATTPAVAIAEVSEEDAVEETALVAHI